MAKRKPTGNRTASEVNNHDDLLWDFAFDQVTAPTNRLLEAQVLRLDQILHVVHLFAHSTRVAGGNQSLARPEFASTLVDCATDLILDYCNSYRRAEQ
jgi:hypothetical protein